MMRSLRRATMRVASWPSVRPIFLLRRGGGAIGARRMILGSVERRRQNSSGRVVDTRLDGCEESKLLRALECFSSNERPQAPEFVLRCRSDGSATE